MKLTLKTKCYSSCGWCDDSQSCEQLKKYVTGKYFEKKTLNPNLLLLQEIHAAITILAWLVSTWYICLTEILEQKHLKLSDHLNQIWGPLATLSALQSFGFFWFPPAKATHLQELAGCFRPRQSSDAQNRAFAKKAEIAFKS